MKNRRPKLRRTVVLLSPELLALNKADWAIAQLRITGGELISRIKLECNEDTISLFYSGRNAFLKEAARARFLGKEAMFLIYVGADIVRRMRQLVGIQQDPNDWSVNSLNGKLKAEHQFRTVVSTEGKKHHDRFIDCPITHSAAKRQLRKLIHCYRLN